MFLQVKRTGHNKIMNSPIYTETRQCDECSQVRSFSYTTDCKPVIVHTIAMRRYNGPGQTDLCHSCRELKEKGFCQPRLL